ncbi:ImmA/IrrE family metallo-endopeptidase [Micromonospora sp. NPDC051141]|uniref:ImmA/IrrE family metallo-endopeptidase n=1 Tax=Micromonospora sp. NPDC051141 TaxID=3364284 RepID=UPI0037A8B8C6
MNKAALKRMAIELREEVGIGVHDVFDPYELAKLYGVKVIPMSSSGCSEEALHHFQVNRPDVFSGALVPFGTGTVILENDLHPHERKRSTCSHEMAHVVLEHPFTAALVNERGCRMANREHEQQAAELSGELLLPFEAAKLLARQQASDEQAAQKFEVSVDLARWRLNSTGARKIASRAKAAYAKLRTR